MKVESSNSEKDKKEIGKLMLSYNQNAIGKIDEKSFMFTLKDENENLVGGVFGNVIPIWMFIDTFVINERDRNKGYGRKLFNMAKKFAIENNCKKIILRTNEYHSHVFYKKNGFKVNSIIEDLPAGYREYTMIKELI